MTGEWIDYTATRPWDAEAMCTQCDWESWYSDAPEKANQHYRQTGHVVKVETRFSFDVGKKQ